MLTPRPRSRLADIKVEVEKDFAQKRHGPKEQAAKLRKHSSVLATQRLAEINDSSVGLLLSNVMAASIDEVDEASVRSAPMRAPRSRHPVP